MHIAEIIVGIVLVFVALLLMAYSVEDGSVVSFGATFIVGAAAAGLAYLGGHGLNAEMHSKHVSIAADVRAQGFIVPSDHVFADSGADLYGSEVYFTRGGCRLAFIARKIDGTWRIGLPRAESADDLIVLRPGDVARLLAACPAR